MFSSCSVARSRFGGKVACNGFELLERGFMDPVTDYYIFYYYLAIANVEPHCSRPRNHQMSQGIGKDDLLQQISLRESFFQPSITIFRRVMLKL